jgi:hypothetical protein
MKKGHTLWILYKKEIFLLKNIFVPVQAMQAYGGGVGLLPHSFLSFLLHRGEWPVS